MKAEKLIAHLRVDNPKRFRLADVDPADTLRPRHREGRGAGPCWRRAIKSLAELCRTCSGPRTATRCWCWSRAWTPPGRTDREHVMSGMNPQGGEVHYVQAALGGRARPRAPLARDGGGCRSGAGSASSTARITKKCSSSGYTRRCSRGEKLPRGRSRGRDLAEAPRRDPSLRALSYAQGDGRSGRSSCTSRRRSSGRRLPAGASTSPGRAGSSRCATSRAPAWDEYMAAYAGAIRAPDPRSAPWYVVPGDQKWDAPLGDRRQHRRCGWSGSTCNFPRSKAQALAESDGPEGAHGGAARRRQALIGGDVTVRFASK